MLPIPLLLLLLAFVIPLRATEDPLAVPEKWRVLARQVTYGKSSDVHKVKALISQCYGNQTAAALHLTYDNRHTRTAQEAFEEKKGNCLSLSALMVGACDAIGVPAHFALVKATSSCVETKSGVKRQERHVVVAIPLTREKDMVLDGTQLGISPDGYTLEPLSRDQARALFHTNRAAESLETGNTQEALARAKTAVALAPTLAMTWNALGVVLTHCQAWKEAKDAFHQAMALDSRCGVAQQNLLWLVKQRSDQALSPLQSKGG